MPPTSDKLEGAILGLLETNGRMSNSQIARHLNISESHVRQKIKRIFGSGRVRRGVVVDFSVLGLNSVWCVRLRVEAAKVKLALAALAEQPATGLVMTVSGSFDIYAIIATENASELASYIDHYIRPLDGFLHIDISIIAEAVKYDLRNTPLRLL